ncbi:hypothetical protein NAT51_08005 [Flavobacterium amniphilum]|nr:hypothetical protein [Flavobacterium amniphilum]MCL9805461.1 hypothetical protein [Flavobacterium amniphilum]
MTKEKNKPYPTQEDAGKITRCAIPIAMGLFVYKVYRTLSRYLKEK